MAPTNTDRLLDATAESRAALPAERAFVVQLRADADLELGVVRGRIEHVLSGGSARFDSLEELLSCIRDVLSRPAERARAARGGAPLGDHPRGRVTSR